MAYEKLKKLERQFATTTNMAGIPKEQSHAISINITINITPEYLRDLLRQLAQQNRTYVIDWVHRVMGVLDEFLREYEDKA